MKSSTDVTIVGAGPYGLSIGAHLRQLSVNFRIIGRPMHSWLFHMPKGMLLKSPGFASSLHDPEDSFTLRRYCQEQGIRYADVDLPIPLEIFCSYGKAFQERLVPEVEEDKLVSLNRVTGGFALRLERGNTFISRNVVLAIGVDYFRHLPAPLKCLPRTLASHSAAHPDLRKFEGQEVAVLGGGASAIDTAVLLHEANASVHHIVRKDRLDFGNPWLGASRSLWKRLREPLSDIGPGWRSKLCVDLPWLYRYLPDEFRLRTARTHLGPSGGWFMEQRAAVVSTLLGYRMDNAVAHGDRVRLDLVHANGGKRQIEVDHVIAATGYYMDVHQLPFLHEDILGRLHLAAGSPRLSAHFESSVPGLYFAGPIAATSFGPLMRFVAGAEFAATRLVRRLSRQSSAGTVHKIPQPDVELES